MIILWNSGNSARLQYLRTISHACLIWHVVRRIDPTLCLCHGRLGVRHSGLRVRQRDLQVDRDSRQICGGELSNPIVWVAETSVLVSTEDFVAIPNRDQCVLPTIRVISQVNRGFTATVVNQDWCGARQHIVRVLAGRSSPAFSLVSEFRHVRGRAWKFPVVRPCCRRRCRQTATRVRAAEWALAGVLPGLGSGMVRGPYAGPATRAGRDPARNLNELPPGLARRGPRPGEVGKAHGADRPHLRTSVPANSPPSPRRRPGVRMRARPTSSALPVVRYAFFCAAWSLAGPRWRSRERAGWAAVPRATRVSGSP